MKILPLDPERHCCDRFRCGHVGLDDYLQRHSCPGAHDGLARIYVAEDGDAQVLGYYTLSPASVRREEWAAGACGGFAKYPVPAVAIGRIAIDIDAQEIGLRLSSRLLMHALSMSLRAAHILDAHCVIADGAPNSLGFYRRRGFYRRFGFMPLQQGGLRFYLPVSEIAHLLPSDTRARLGL